MSGHHPPIFGPKKSSKTSPKADEDWRLRYEWGPYACRLVPVTICSRYHRTTLLGWERLKLKASKVFVSLSRQFVFKWCFSVFFFRFFSEQLVSLLFFAAKNIQLQIPALFPPLHPSTPSKKSQAPRQMEMTRSVIRHQKKVRLTGEMMMTWIDMVTF